LNLGVVEGIEREHKPVKQATKMTGPIAVRIKGDKSIQAGRHFEEKDQIVSLLTRKSIDCLKEYFREDMTPEYWDLVRKLKKTFEIL
jgi:translation initiation factor 5B